MRREIGFICPSRLIGGGKWSPNSRSQDRQPLLAPGCFCSSTYVSRYATAGYGSSRQWGSPHSGCWHAPCDPQESAEPEITRAVRREGRPRNGIPSPGATRAEGEQVARRRHRRERGSQELIRATCPLDASLVRSCQAQRWVGCVRGGSECEAGPPFFCARPAVEHAALGSESAGLECPGRQIGRGQVLQRWCCVGFQLGKHTWAALGQAGMGSPGIGRVPAAGGRRHPAARAEGWVQAGEARKSRVLVPSGATRSEIMLRHLGQRPLYSGASALR